MTPQSSVAARWPLWFGLGALVVCIAATLRGALAQTGGRLIYALDDAYIHMAMAKNLALHGVWGCTPFHFSSSSSSPLWTLVLGLSYVVTGVRDVTPLVLNVIAAAATLVVVDAYLSRVSAPAVLRATTLLGVIVAVPMPAAILMGMEHVLHLLLTIVFAIAAVDALTQAEDSVHGTAHTGRLCALAASLVAARYEGLFLAGIVALACAARRDPRRAVLVGASAIAPVAILGAISVANGGLFLPNSLMLKAGGESASAFAVLLKPLGPEDVAFYRNTPSLLLLAVGGVVAAMAHGIVQRRFWCPSVLMPSLLAFDVVLHGHYVFSSTFWAYRYDAYLIGFGVFAAAVTLASWAPAAAAPRRVRVVRATAATVCLGVVVAVAGDVKGGWIPRAEFDGAGNTYREHYETARFIRGYYPDGTVVVNDLGAVSYFTNAHIVDLVGLGNVEPLLIRRSTGDYTGDDVARWTATYAPAIGIVQLDWSWVAPRVPRTWIKAAEVRVPTHGQRIGFFAIDSRATEVLRRSVEAHFLPLAATAGYQLVLF